MKRLSQLKDEAIAALSGNWGKAVLATLGLLVVSIAFSMVFQLLSGTNILDYYEALFTNDTAALREAMGGNIDYIDRREVSGEEVCDINVRTSQLHGTVIEGDIIPTLIDELPVIAVMAAFADGETIIRDAAELKVKESDRIATVSENLRAMGCDIRPTDDGFVIEGGRPLHGALIHTYKDHRIAMSFAVASLAADGESELDDYACVDISYPGFFRDLSGLCGKS